MTSLFLPGVPEDLVRAALSRARSEELGTPGFVGPQGSAALSVNGFGWFLDRPAELPPFPGVGGFDWPPVSVEIERQVQFPWDESRPPPLDAVVETARHVIGIASHRFDPGPDDAPAGLPEVYDRDIWGERMGPWCAMRDRLRANPHLFTHLDAALFVQHALAMAIIGERSGKAPALLYLYAEPRRGREVSGYDLVLHRQEIAHFAVAVSNARVRFTACHWRDWLDSFRGQAAAHAARMIERFDP